MRDVVVISIQPEFAEMILRGEKRIEFRKTRPSFGPGTRALIYASSPVQRIIGVFEVAEVHEAAPSALWRRVGRKTPHVRHEVLGYFGDAAVGYGIEIAWARRMLPRPLPRGMKPTQLWQFLDRSQEGHRLLVRAALRPATRARLTGPP